MSPSNLRANSPITMLSPRSLLTVLLLSTLGLSALFILTDCTTDDAAQVPDFHISPDTPAPWAVTCTFQCFPYARHHARLARQDTGRYARVDASLLRVPPPTDGTGPEGPYVDASTLFDPAAVAAVVAKGKHATDATVSPKATVKGDAENVERLAERTYGSQQPQVAPGPPLNPASPAPAVVYNINDYNGYNALNRPSYGYSPHLRHPSKPSYEMEKFFLEHQLSGHQDARYFSAAHLTDARKRREALGGLLEAWFRFGDEHGVVSWIAHGTLIGWFWNGEMLPWDEDIDVQTTLHHLALLLPHHDTLVQDRYLLQLNPHASYRGHELHNVIDARLVDTVSGLYVDVTALAELYPTSATSAHPSAGKLFCKSPHAYRYGDIFPLHETRMYIGNEGEEMEEAREVRVWRPHGSMEVLQAEYGEKAMTSETIKTCQIRDWRLGLLHYALNLAILVYVIYEIISRSLYFDRSPVAGGSIRTTLLLDPAINSSQPPSYCSDPAVSGCLFWTEQEALYPDDTSNNCFITTRVTITRYNLPPSTCPNGGGANTSLPYLSSARDFTCNPFRQPVASTNKYYIAYVENMTLLIDHTARSSANAVVSTTVNMKGSLVDFNNNLYNVNGTQFDDAYHASNVARNIQGDVISISDVVRAAGGDLSAPFADVSAVGAKGVTSQRDAGMVISWLVSYANRNENWAAINSGRLQYTYFPKRVKDSKYKLVESFYTGEGAYTVDRHGILISFNQSGQIGTFSFIALLTSLVASFALLKVSSVLVDILMLQVLPEKMAYKSVKFEVSEELAPTEDLSPNERRYSLEK
ncbi:cytochrome c oxidase subunit 1 [Irineochytrium annulatum]|nr:cytochrome c oxidase subunit 1 [Irineochytrium annulatum]